MDCSLLGSSVRGISQARTLEWVAISSLGGLPNPGMEPASLMSSALPGGFFTTVLPGEGNGNPLQCSCLGNPLDRGAWWAAVHGVAKGQIQLGD